MIIASLTKAVINGIRINIGKFDYDIDPMDEKTASQLRVLRDDIKTIAFEGGLITDLPKAEQEAYKAKVKARSEKPKVKPNVSKPRKTAKKAK